MVHCKKERVKEARATEGKERQPDVQAQAASSKRRAKNDTAGLWTEIRHQAASSGKRDV